MGQAVLVDAVIRDGGQLLRQLAEHGGGFTGALWYLHPDTREWRLLVEMPAVTTSGPLAAYTRVDEVLMTARPPLVLRLADITLVASLAAQVVDEPERPAYLLGSPAAEGVLTPCAFVYSLRDLRHPSPVPPPRRARTEPAAGPS